MPVRNFRRIRGLDAAEVMLGSDPEFELVRGGEVRRAECNGYRFRGSVGCDGAGGPVEIRPRPSEEVPKVLGNIARLFRCVYQRRKDKLSVGGNRYPLGCHIHFGVGNIPPDDMRAICTAMDDFLGRKLLDLSGSARSGYRRLGAFNQNEHGFEYRSLPAAVLHNPRIAGVVFLAAKRIVERMSKRNFSYETDGAGNPTAKEYVSLVGERNFAALENFVVSYGRRMRSGRKIMLDRSWLDSGKVKAAAVEAVGQSR